MSIFVLGSREVVAAFAMGGMRGRAVGDPDEIRAALQEVVVAGPEPVRVLVVEETAAESVRSDIERLKLDREGPLVVEVAGVRGPHERRKSPLQLVQEALGIRI